MGTYTLSTTARLDAGLAAACAAYNTANATSLTSDEYLASRVNDVLTSYADAHNVGIITPYEFVARFTPAEYSAIVDRSATDANVAALLARLKAVTEVHLFVDETQNGIAYLVAVGLLTSDRGAAILAM